MIAANRIQAEPKVNIWLQSSCHRSPIQNSTEHPSTHKHSQMYLLHYIWLCTHGTQMYSTKDLHNFLVHTRYFFFNHQGLCLSCPGLVIFSQIIRQMIFTSNSAQKKCVFMFECFAWFISDFSEKSDEPAQISVEKGDFGLKREPKHREMPQICQGATNTGLEWLEEDNLDGRV